MQIQYNITRIEEWCKSHDIPEGTLQLEHLMQSTKLLQLKKVCIYNSKSYKIAFIHFHPYSFVRFFRIHWKILTIYMTYAGFSHLLRFKN